MKNAQRVLFLLFVAASGALRAENVTTIRSNGDPSNRVDIVILGDGYTAGELAKYAADVETFITGVFEQEPFKEYALFFNVHRIDVVSNESGADHPSRGIYKDTALDATYDSYGIARLLTVSTAKANAVLGRSVAPNQQDMKLVIVNDPEYGGSGGSWAVASVHSSAVELILHEEGHSFGLLGDEYAYEPPTCNNSTEPSAPNVTKATNRSLIKWNAGGGPPLGWIELSTPVPTSGTTPGLPGLYEGAMYCATGLYRPTYESKMRSLSQPFYQVNGEQLVKRIYNWVSPLDSWSPTVDLINMALGGEISLTVTVPPPFSHALDIKWFVDGQFQATGTGYTFRGTDHGAGSHTVTVSVTDTTAMVRNDPSGALTDQHAWSISVSSVSTATVITAAVSSVTTSSAWGGGNVTADGGGTVTERGVCWGTAPGPTIGQSHTHDGSGLGAYASQITGLQPNSVYYVRAYATNPAGTAYGDDVAFVTLSSMGQLATRHAVGDFDGDGADEVAVDFGATGAWMYNGGSWSQLTAANPESLAAADVDGDGVDEMLADLGSSGLWLWNAGAWNQLSGLNVDGLAPGDTDADGAAEVAADFGTAGLWLWNAGAWNQLSGVNAEHVITADVSGTSAEEIIGDFGATGLWSWGVGAWTQLSGVNADDIAAGAWSGGHYLVGDFGSAGLWQWKSGSWTQLSGINASYVITADLNGNGEDDVVGAFGLIGLWAYDGSNWTQLSGLAAEYIIKADTDGDGDFAVVGDFGATGLWIDDGGSWSQLSGVNPEYMIAGDFDSDNADEIAADFGPIGLWLWNNGSWSQISGLNPE